MNSWNQIKKGWHLLGRFCRECLPPYHVKFFYLWILHAVFAVMLLLPPLIIQQLVDVGVAQEDFSFVLILGIAIVVIFSLGAVVHWVRHYFGHLLAQRVTFNLRNRLYWHLQKLSFRFHDNVKVGELLSRLIDDLNRGEEVIYHGPEVWVTNGVTITLTAALLFYLNPVLAAVCLPFIALIAVVAFIISRKMFRAERGVRKKKADLAAQAEDNLAGIRVIQSFAREGYELERFKEHNLGHYNKRKESVFWLAWLFPAAVFILSITLALAVIVGGYQVIEGTGAMSVGALIAFVMYLHRLMFPLLALFMSNERLLQYFTGIERYFNFLDRDPEIKDKAGALPLGRARGEIQFRDVWFQYDDTPVLKGINLYAEPGKTVALVGPSGTGKTTITRLIPRFYEPCKGSLLVDGTDVRDLRLSDLRSNIGLVMQDDYLFNETLLDNIAYGRDDVSREELLDAARQAHVDVFVDELPEGYETNIGQRGVKVSEGQAQRISIARAIVKDPPILILDEATSSVDSETELLIQDALETIMEDKTCFIIAHRLSTVVNADQICFIKGGVIVEKGSHQELIAEDGFYAHHYRLQARDKSPASSEKDFS